MQPMRVSAMKRRASDEDQIRIWYAAICLMDRRERWPRAMLAAIRMILARDPALRERLWKRGVRL